MDFRKFSLELGYVINMKNISQAIRGRVGDKCRVTLGEVGGAWQPTCSQIWWNSIMQSLASLYHIVG